MKHIMHFALQKAKPRNASKSLYSIESKGDFVIKQMLLLGHYVGLI
jgi:hypothetical protein